MKLYIGGFCQGQAELAMHENPDSAIFFDFQETIRNVGEPRSFAADFCKAHPDAVVVANEVGSGIVPLSASDRVFREAVGRALCVIAQNSEAVTRVVCGIGVRIK